MRYWLRSGEIVMECGQRNVRGRGLLQDGVGVGA